MNTNQIIIEYLKIILSTQVVAGVVALILFTIFKEDIKRLLTRIAKIKLPGGSEFYTSQKEKDVETIEKDKVPKVNDNDATEKLSEELKLTPEQVKIVSEAFESERANAYLWEYKYLNLFLVPNTKNVLDWFYSLDKSISVSFFDNIWKTIIPDEKEREAILKALLNHYLIIRNDGDMLVISPKGKEYKDWKDKN